MNVNKWLRCVAVVAVASTAACGGGGGGSSGGGGSTPVVDAPVGGLWAGTVTPQGQPASEVFGIVTEDGRAYFLDEFSQMYWGFVDASGTTLHGDMTMADADGFLLWDDSHSAEVTLTGSVQARTRLTANWNLVTSNASRQQGVMSVQYDGLYAEDSSLAKVAGNYRDVLGGDDVVNVAANGTLFSQSARSICVA